MFLKLIEDNLIYTVMALGGVLLIVLLIQAVLLVKINQTAQRYRTFMRGNTRASLEEHLFNYSAEVHETNEKMKELKQVQAEIHHTLKSCIQNVGLVRFDAYENTGGKLSFALALMDGYGNGIVVSSLHGRSESHIYAKPVKRGSSTYPLSQEEELAIQQAVRSKLV